jgi:DedD protein
MKTATEREAEHDSEITLNATTLLGIFFGLVLVCGVFFGFGYSTGRRGNETPSAATPEQNSAPAAAHTPKPSAMQSLQAATSNTGADPNTVTESLDEDSTPDNAPGQPPAPQVKQTALTQTPMASPSAKSTTTPAATQASLPLASAGGPAPMSGGSVMVQIAAVTHQEDADALVAALRQRGYRVSVRNEPQDNLLHIQVGPFATRDDAKVMRSKLLADGYNAILKP